MLAVGVILGVTDELIEGEADGDIEVLGVGLFDGVIEELIDGEAVGDSDVLGVVDGVGE